MTAGLDIVTNDAGEFVRLERARELGAGVVVALYRTLRLAQLHDLTNAAFVRQLEDTQGKIADYCLRAGVDLDILFAKRAVFVAGQLLKGSRAAYEAAAELGEMLEQCGGAELTIQQGATKDDLKKLAELVRGAGRGEKGRLPLQVSPRVRLRVVAEAARVRGLHVDEPPQQGTPERARWEDEKVVRAYASAVVLLRRFFEELGRGASALPRGVKRVAQMLVDLSMGSTPAFLGVTEARGANADAAGRAVITAILAVATARELTDDRAVLSEIAIAAMLADVGRVDALAHATAPRLSDREEEDVPARTAAVLTALGRVNEPTITRTVIAFESLWHRRAAELGPLYGGVRGATLQARIVAIARRYNDLLTPEPGLSPPSMDHAVATLACELKDSTDRTVLRMLVAATGALPVGTVVQLSTGEVGEVTGGGALGRPRLRLVMDARGEVVESPLEVDLGRPDASGGLRHIATVLSTDGWSKGKDRGSERISEAPPSSAPRSSSPSIGTTPSAVAQAASRVFAPTSSRPLGDTDLRRTKFTVPPSVRAGARDPLRDRSPTAHGTLGATPLVHVLVYVLDHALSGTVVFREPDGVESSIYFLEGAAAKVKTDRPVAFLGDELAEAGLVPRELVDKALESAKRLGVLLGEYLVGTGLLTEPTLATVLVRQLKKKIAALANVSAETSYAFYRDVNALDSWAGERVLRAHPLDTVLAAVRGWHDRARIHATLSRIGAQKLVLHPEVDLTRIALLPEEEAVLAVLRAEATTLRALVQRKFADEDAISSLVYTLAVTRQLAQPGSTAAPMAYRHDERVRAAEAEDSGDRISGLPFSAVIDPLAPTSLPAQKVASARSPARAGEDDPQEISDADVIVEFDIEDHEPALQAMSDFRNAEAALERGDLAGAVVLAQRAAKADPKRSEYAALYAWTRATRNNKEAPDAIANLTRLLARDPQNERALLYRGQLHSRGGQPREALRDFERILEFSPQHHEAASLARLMRQRLAR